MGLASHWIFGTYYKSNIKHGIVFTSNIYIKADFPPLSRKPV